MGMFDEGRQQLPCMKKGKGVCWGGGWIQDFAMGGG